MAMVPKFLGVFEGNGRILPGLILAAGSLLCAQDTMPVSGPGGAVRLFTADAAILESSDARKDLNCLVTPTKPSLGFDLKFHSGYEVSIPLQDLRTVERCACFCRRHRQAAVAGQELAGLSRQPGAHALHAGSDADAG